MCVSVLTIKASTPYVDAVSTSDTIVLADLVLLFKYHTDGYAFKTKLFPQPFLQKPFVVLFYHLRFITEKSKNRGSRFNLCYIVYFELFAARRRVRSVLYVFLQLFIQQARFYLFASFVIYFFGIFQYLMDPLLR